MVSDPLQQRDPNHDYITYRLIQNIINKTTRIYVCSIIATTPDTSLSEPRAALEHPLNSERIYSGHIATAQAQHRDEA